MPRRETLADRTEHRDRQGDNVVEVVESWEQKIAGIRAGTLEGRVAPADLAAYEMLHKFDNFIIREDASILVVNKPPGVISHNLYSTDGRPSFEVGVQEIAQYKRGKGVRLAHRLDKDTSGVLVLTKTEDASRFVKDQFARKKESGMRKFYFAVVDNIFEGRREIATVLDDSQSRVRVVDAPVVDTFDFYDEPLKVAYTIIEPVKYLDTVHGPKTVVQVEIITGRRHQIRVVAANLGFPLVGDYVYNSGVRTAPRQLLHALELRLTHPDDEKQMVLKARPHSDISTWIKEKTKEFSDPPGVDESTTLRIRLKSPR